MSWILQCLGLESCLPSLVYKSHPLKKYRDLLIPKHGIITLDKTLLPTAHNDRRLVFIGDVHGCLEELKRLLKKVEFDAKTDHIIFVGDLVAKGPFSLETITYIDEELGAAASCVRGNHDDKLMQWNEYLIHKHDVKSDKLPDGLSRRDEHRFLAKNLDAEQVDYLEALPYIIRIPMEREYIVCHAGLVPGISLSKQKCWDVTNVRNIYHGEALDHRENGKGWFIEWEEQQKSVSLAKRQTVIYGHDAGRDLNMREHSIGLDSRCVRGGQLTAMVMSWGSTVLMHEQAKQRYD